MIWRVFIRALIRRLPLNPFAGRKIYLALNGGFFT